MKKEIRWINLAVLAGLIAVILAVQLLGFSKVLGDYAVGVVITCYLLGKIVRDYELKIWEQRQARAGESFNRIEPPKGK